MDPSTQILTASELRVLEQASRGLSLSESGAETFHSFQTVKSLRKYVMQKLGARNITHAVAIAYQQGILD